MATYTPRSSTNGEPSSVQLSSGSNFHSSRPSAARSKHTKWPARTASVVSWGKPVSGEPIRAKSLSRKIVMVNCGDPSVSDGKAGVTAPASWL